MDILIQVINVYFMFVLGRFIINLFISAKQNPKSKKGNVEKEEYKNSWSEKVENIKREINMLETVKDDICGAYIKKERSYQVVEEEKTHYFCSWECRQKYLQEKSKNK